MSVFLISAIISTFNSSKFIKGKLEDLLNQTIADVLEIIIVNSGSLENEEEIINEYRCLPNIKYIRTEQRESIYKAWNRGIKIATGVFITNANTDDRLRKDALEILSKELTKKPDVGLIYPDQYISDKPNMTYEQVLSGNSLKPYNFPDYTYLRQIDRCLISSQPMWRASLHFNDNIWFNEQYEICGDYDFTMKVAQSYKLFHLKEYLGVFYLSPSKENKSFKDTDSSIAEMAQISEPYIKKFVDSQSDVDLKNVQQLFRFFINMPIPLLYFYKQLNIILKPGLARDKLFHTIEFIYFLFILICIKQGDYPKALKLGKKILRYKNSERIRRNITQLIKERNGKKN